MDRLNQARILSGPPFYKIASTSAMPDEIEQVNKLLSNSFRHGFLSDESAEVMDLLPQAASDIARALGSDPTSRDRDVLLFTVLVDDSDSIAFVTNGCQAEEQGHDALLDSLAARQEATEALVHTRLLNQGTFSPYRSLTNAKRLSPGKLKLSHAGTPLYRQSVLTLWSVITKARQLEEEGRRVRTVTLIITDGEDNASGTIAAQHVRFLVGDMLRLASNHLIVGLGIGEGFRPTFLAMGIPKGHIMTASAVGDNIKKTLDDFFKDKLGKALESEDSFLQLSAGDDEESEDGEDEDEGPASSPVLR